MVLDTGKVVEFDTPANLLRRDGGFLRALVDESADAERLYSLAMGKDAEEMFVPTGHTPLRV